MKFDKDLFAIVPFGFVILNYVLINFYYSMFGVDINSYLSVSETVALGLLSLGKVLSVEFWMSIIITGFLLGIGVRITKWSPFSVKDGKEEKKGLYEHLSVYSIVQGILISLILIIFLSGGFPKHGLIFIFILLFIGIPTIFFFEKLYMDNQNISNKKGWIFWASIFLFILTLSAVNEKDNILKGKYNGTKIVTSKKTYLSDLSNFYIGRTQSAVFFYDKRKRITVIPSGEIEEITIAQESED